MTDVKRELSPKIQTNILKGFQFKLEIDSLPHVTYHAQTVPLPGMSIDTPSYNTSHRDILLPGTKLTFDPLTVTFLVDDDLSNYKEIYHWLLKMAFGRSDYSEMQSDGVLHVLNGDLTAKTTIKFLNLHPTSLSELNFDSSQSDVEPQIAFMTMEYDYFLFDGDRLL